MLALERLHQLWRAGTTKHDLKAHTKPHLNLGELYCAVESKLSRLAVTHVLQTNYGSSPNPDLKRVVSLSPKPYKSPLRRLQTPY